MKVKLFFFFLTYFSLGIFTKNASSAATIPEPIQTPHLTNYFTFMSDDFIIRLGGRVKLDGIYDVNAEGNAYGLNPATIPLQGVTPEADNKGHFNYGIGGSRLHLDARKTFCNIDTRAYIETDFAKDLNNTTNNPAPRIRHFYVDFDFKGSDLLVGQTWFNFQDIDAFARTLDNLYGGFWQAQVRYTQKFGYGLSLSFAIEKPDSQYVDSSNQLNNNNGFGKSQVPDLSAKLRLDHPRGHIALSGILRSLQAFVSSRNDDSLKTFTKHTSGWGIGFTGRLIVYNKSSIYWQVNGGQGLDRYIDDSSNQDLYIQFPTAANPTLHAKIKAIPVVNYILGVEICFTDRLSSNLAASITCISKVKGIDVSLTNYNRLQQRYHANIIYKALPSTDVGLEIMHYTRRAGTTKTFHGKDTRILISLIHNFGA